MSMATASTFAPGRFQPFPERVQGIGAFAFTDEHHSAGVQIQHDGKILRLFATEISSIAIRR